LVLTSPPPAGNLGQPRRREKGESRYKKKKIRIDFINYLAPDIQSVLKISDAKCFITDVKIISTETHTELWNWFYKTGAISF
jgi:hypothetical protein